MKRQGSEGEKRVNGKRIWKGRGKVAQRRRESRGANTVGGGDIVS